MKSSIIASLFFAVTALASPLAHGPDEDDHAPATGLKTASQIAKAAGFTSLLAALDKAGLTSTVDGLTDITLFAPTNEAFAKISSTTAGLSKEQLAAVLKYHIVKGVIKSTDLKNGASVPTLNGAPITVSLNGKSAQINKSNVVKTDIAFKGGIGHVIDAVLLPPAKK